MADVTDSCATCRHHRREMVPADAETGFDEIVAIADDDVPNYFCRAEQPEREIGRLPILCFAFAPSRKSTRLEELDARMRRFDTKNDKDSR